MLPMLEARGLSTFGAILEEPENTADFLKT